MDSKRPWVGYCLKPAQPLLGVQSDMLLFTPTLISWDRVDTAQGTWEPSRYKATRYWAHEEVKASGREICFVCGNTWGRRPCSHILSIECAFKLTIQKSLGEFEAEALTLLL